MTNAICTKKDCKKPELFTVSLIVFSEFAEAHIVRGLLRLGLGDRRGNERGHIRLFRQPCKIAGQIDDNTVNAHRQLEGAHLGPRLIALVFDNLESRRIAAARAGGSAAVARVQLGLLLALVKVVIVDRDAVERLVGLTAVLQRLVVEVDGVTAADEEHANAECDQRQHDGNTNDNSACFHFAASASSRF